MRRSAKYINHISSLTLNEVLEEVSRINKVIVFENFNNIISAQNYEDLATCAIALNNFFSFATVKRNKTLRELKDLRRLKLKVKG